VKKASWFGQKGRRSVDKVKDFGTLIGVDSSFSGTLRGKDNYAVYGAVEGDCELEGALMLGPSGRWKGNISAAVVFIGGEVEGNVTALEKLEIAPGARVRGNLSSVSIAIADGAVFEGEVKMSKSEQVTHFAERRGSGQPAGE